MTRFAIFAALLAVQFASGVSGYEEVRQLLVTRKTSVGGEESLRAHQPYGKEYSLLYSSDAASPEKKVFPLQRGTNGLLSPVTGQVTFCQLKDPEGVQTPLIIGPCQYNIPVVTARHEGNWTVVYGTDKAINPKTEYFNVTTNDGQAITSSVNLTKDNETQLLCHVHVSKPQTFKFCHFTKPDGRVLSLSPGIEEDRYKSIFNVENNNQDFYCGLIVKQPNAEDYGAWRCLITDEDKKSYGTVLHLSSRNQSNDYKQVMPLVHVAANEVYVKQNNLYQIKCTATAALSYCWFRSPNGTAYSVSQSEVRTPFSLPYVGSGLPLGDCTAEINHASFTDQGEWTCYVGVVNGAEIHRSFTVHVADSYVIPNRTKLVATGYDSIFLSCNILPNITDRAVHYCRWIRPDGYGIYNGVSHRYTTNTSSTRCELIIAGGSHVIEDLGNWTCVAGLIGANSAIEESRATVTVRQKTKKYQTLFGVTVALSMTLMIIVSALSFVQLYKRLRPLPAEPPPYTAEAAPIPKFMKAECSSKEFRY